jgi:hypothetical protein
VPNSFIRDLFTGPANDHYELARVAFAVALISALIFQGYAIAKGQEFDIQAFGIAFATMLAAGGLGISLKDKARPYGLDGNDFAPEDNCDEPRGSRRRSYRVTPSS